MKKIIEIINHQKIKQNRLMLIGVFIIMFLAFAFQKETEKTNPLPLIESADTYIPAGFVLVPIELTNIESLQSLIGEYAVVDLFHSSINGKNVRVGRHLKLLRAPLNPQQFAVLVPENQVSTLMGVQAPLWAAIQNPNKNEKTEMTTAAKSRIEFGEGTNP